MNPELITIAKALAWGNMRLAASVKLSGHCPGLEAQILLGKVLHKPKEFLFAHPEIQLSKSQQKNYLKNIEARLQGKPVSQIINQREFYSRIFFVNKDVLTPRPETETLIETILKELTTNHYPARPLQIADIGTGSGCIAITLACELQKLKIPCEITACDISQEALQVAQKNLKSLLPQDQKQVKLLRLNILKEELPGEFDIIVANPPYIPGPEITELPVEVKIYEPRLALDGGQDGLDFYRRLEQVLKSSLKQNGIAVFEIHSPLAKKTGAIFSKKYDPEFIYDLSSRPRVLLLRNSL